MTSPLPHQSLSASANDALFSSRGDANKRSESLSPVTTRSKGGTTATSNATIVPRAKSALSLSTPSLLPVSVSTTAPARSTRPFRSIIGKGGITTKWVTREIAALEFLQTGIPMAKEGSIVHEGWMRQHNNNNHQGRISTRDDPWSKRGRNRGEIDHDSFQAAETDEAKSQLEEDYPQISPSLLPLNSTPKNTVSSPALVRQGRWWEKWIVGQTPSNPEQVEPEQQQQRHQQHEARISRDSKIEDLEEPNEPEKQQQQHPLALPTTATSAIYAPGRRLEGDVAIRVQIPLANTLKEDPPPRGTNNLDSSHHTHHFQRQRNNSDLVSLQSTKHQSIARMAMTREWELRVAHGLEERHLHPHEPQQHYHHSNPPMLDGRMYMSAKESYPMMVYSLLRYEPRKEEALRRRKKLEERGGGGTQFFIMPSRDWRGISFRALLPAPKEESEVEAIEVEPAVASETVETLRNENANNPIHNPKLLFDRFAGRRADGVDLSVSETKDLLGDEGRPEKNNQDDADDDDYDLYDTDTFAGDTYVAGLLDDPEMVQGRHRNVMIGDKGTGPIVSSTIQFVKPALLKADLNKQFRERFDGYEPPESQRKFIKAKVINGMYTLMDQEIDEDGNNSTKNNNDIDDNDTIGGNTTGTAGTPTTGATTNASTTNLSKTSNHHRRRKDSTSSMSLSSVVGGSNSIDGTGETGNKTNHETIRMPPSLTLSKIRSLKRQALAAAVRARLEISTVALAIIYFERLCLDCRVDKSNRRLSFAACLLLAIKINEAHVGVITTQAVENNSSATSSRKSKTSQRIQSLIRPNKKSSSMFASLLVFFTEDWKISLKHLFAAEWGVFAALQFRLTAKPSDVAFHFKRLMKTLGYDPRRYLGSHVFGSWQKNLAEEEFRRQQWEARMESRRQRKEEQELKQLQREIEEAAADRRGSGNGATSPAHDEKNGNEEQSIIDTVDDFDASQKGLLMSRSGTTANLQSNTRRRRLFGDIIKTRLTSGVGGLEGLPKRSVSSERSQLKHPDTFDKTHSHHSAALLPEYTTSVGSVKGNPLSRPRPPLLRPLSQSKSMLSLSAKGRELMLGRNNDVDSTDIMSEGNSTIPSKSSVSPKNLTAKGRIRVLPPINTSDANIEKDEMRSMDEETGIMI